MTDEEIELFDIRENLIIANNKAYSIIDYIEELQEYIRKLETNIAEAIKLLLDNTADYTDGDFESMRFQNDIVKILGRGKENE